MEFFFIVIIIAAVLIFYLWYLYNDLVVAKVRLKEGWSQIDVQLKRRSDLIPNLVETIKGYAKHEKSVFENVTKARSLLMSAGTPNEKADANDQLGSALKSLFAVAENYPNLRASDNFIQLQKELSDTEDKVAFSRQFYNSAVGDFNTKIQTFPNVLIASNLGFKQEDFFEATVSERKKVDVKFE